MCHVADRCTHRGTTALGLIDVSDSRSSEQRVSSASLTPPSSESVSSRTSRASRRWRSSAAPRMLALALGALGVVYGDIGTSPLYAMSECFAGEHGVAADRGERARRPVADLLVADARRHRQVPDVRACAPTTTARAASSRCSRWSPSRQGAKPARARRPDPARRCFGAALLYGDGVITPAISVLGAVEGLEVATPTLQAARRADHASRSCRRCSSSQQRGTARVGALFGPVMLLWFVTIAALGRAVDRARSPAVLARDQPAPRGARSSAHNGSHGFLRARLGRAVHHRRRGALRRHGPLRQRPIRLAWFASCSRRCCSTTSARARCSSREPERASSNPFYALVPELAALSRWSSSRRSAAIIASQALISGAFSLTQPGGAARLLPARHDRAHVGEHRGADLHPRGQLALMVGVRRARARRSRARATLAAAYGIAVTGTMAITLDPVLRRVRAALGLLARRAVHRRSLFLVIDLAFFGANALKFAARRLVPVSWRSAWSCS